jgi:hypothetical protein
VILEEAAMITIAATLGRDSHIADLSKLRIIVESRYLELSQDFR